MPTGVHLRDVREQLFGAADRLLVQGGASALTSRAVTAEAGVAKGVLHRHFDDFDAFLAEYVLDRVDKMDERAKALLGAAGAGEVVDNLAEAISAVFGSVAVAIVALVTFRDDLRRRLRETWPAGVPVLTDAAIMIRNYLERERELGRVGGIDADGVAPMLIGTAHLLFADRDAPPDAEAVRRMVRSVLNVK
ncbi:TetR/AcrR family transcriptional regulator [Lentzea aerocolonigenes]|uniref:TetR/AcrR family transcriptional regulator n=1 Tax=Lentzea aerocolonigenes TaxID=68170 RepID=UPI0004C30CED|nr:TetR/AcrR family transcriptional regulator [Lentzea aerocolonigenes]MCP2243164.1 transcriptional regulator, TetR family [Lentzea aerocolonigenes]